MTYVEHLFFLKVIKESKTLDELDEIFVAIPWDVTKDQYVKEVWLHLSDKMNTFRGDPV